MENGHSRREAKRFSFAQVRVKVDVYGRGDAVNKPHALISDAEGASGPVFVSYATADRKDGALCLQGDRAPRHALLDLVPRRRAWRKLPGGDRPRHGLADSDHLFGALTLTVAVIALAEVARPLRYLNLLFGLWIAASPFLLSGAGSTAAVVTTSQPAC